MVQRYSRGRAGTLMKVAVVSDSPSDEAAVRIIVETILEREIEFIEPAIRTRGWPNVRIVLPAILKQLYYHADTDGLVVVVDADHSPPHEDTHDLSGEMNAASARSGKP